MSQQLLNLSMLRRHRRLTAVSRNKFPTYRGRLDEASKGYAALSVVVRRQVASRCAGFTRQRALLIAHYRTPISSPRPPNRFRPISSAKQKFHGHVSHFFSLVSSEVVKRPPPSRIRYARTNRPGEKTSRQCRDCVTRVVPITSDISSRDE